MVLLSLTIHPNTSADAQKLMTALQQLAAEDSSVLVRPGQLPGEAVIGCDSEQRLELIVDRLKREFGVEARVSCPEVAYKETLTRPADGEVKFARHRGGRGHYAHVKIHVYPGERGSGCVFENEILGGEIPKDYIKPVEEGIKESLTRGVLAGYPVDDVRVVLYEGSYHQADSSEMTFKMAGAMALQDAAKKADPVLLEPVMRLEVIVPEEHTTDVSSDLSRRRGQIESQKDHDGKRIITARVPLAEMFGYATDLRSRTRGHGTYVMCFDTYAPVRTPDGGGPDPVVGARRKPPRPRRNSSVALPEPDENAP